MGNSEIDQDSQPEESNIYNPNFFVGKIIGDNESRQNDVPINSFDKKNKIDKGALIREKKW